MFTKPVNCTCQYPNIRYRNMSGHQPGCPVHVEFLRKMPPRVTVQINDGPVYEFESISMDGRNLVNGTKETDADTESNIAPMNSKTAVVEHRAILEAPETRHIPGPRANGGIETR